MSRDMEKLKKAQHNHYVTNKEKYLESGRNTKRRRAAWLQELKKTLSCIKCDIKDFRVLEFHHRERVPYNGQTDRYTVSYLLNHAGKKRVLEEIAKCDCLCANCHKIEHWKEEEQEYK